MWNKILEVYDFAAFSFIPVENQDSPLLVCSPEQPHKQLINKMKSYACQSTLFYSIHSPPQDTEIRQ